MKRLSDISTTAQQMPQSNLHSNFLGEAIKAEMFGTNFLFNRDGVDNGQGVSQTYDRYISDASVSTLRYPGGTITESLFDLSNPNSPLQSFIEGANSSSTTQSLNSFLKYASSINASATIVLPTYRFFSDNIDASGHHVISLEGDAVLRNFLSVTLDEAFQRGATISAFELGNEWHVRNEDLFGFSMTPVEYGRVASYLAKVVQEEIDAFRAEHALGAVWPEPKVVVQVGPGGAAEWYTADGFRPPPNYTGELVSATELIFREFDTVAEQRAVDGILIHRYLKGDDASVSGWAYSPFKTWDQLASADSDFKVADRYVTEWNVAADNKTELGLKQFDSMVLLFEEMVEAGVDHANVWAVQQRNATRLIENSGIGDETWGGMSFGGLAFDMMSAQLPGQYLMPAKVGSAALTSVSFGSADKVVIFLTNRSGAPIQEAVNLGTIAPGFHHGMIVEVSATQEGMPNVQVSTDQARFSQGNVTLQFAPNETVMLVLSLNQAGVFVETYDETAGQIGPQTGSMYNDVFEGSDLDEAFNGSGGNDRLDGRAGSDVLDGGAGNDTLIGGAGNDVLVGGAGVDIASYASATADLVLRLLGGPQAIAGFGADSFSGIEGLEGGSGNDFLRGDQWSNVLFGGAGSDTLQGGTGNDTLNGGSGTDTANYADAASSVTVNLALSTAQKTGGGGTDVLQLIEGLIGSGFQDTLTGSAGANRISGGAGNDLITGGLGADCLLGGDGNDIFLLPTFAEHAAGERIVGGAGTDELRLNGTQAGWLVLGAGVEVDHVVIGTGTAATALTNGTTAIHVDAQALLAGVSITGNAGSNILIGSRNADRLFGGAGNDKLIGGAGNDILLGGAGNDVLFGGAGVDVLMGGDGTDVFVFNLAPTSINRDSITDFNSELDAIHLAVSAMPGLGTSGAFSEGAFLSGEEVVSAQDAMDRILYNATTGAVLYDADGAGGVAAIQFLQLTPGTALHATDLILI